MNPQLLFLPLFLIQTSFAEWKPVSGTLLTPWGAKTDPVKAWQEYARPQLRREGWTNLNGLWDYKIAPKGEENAAAMGGKGEAGKKEEGAAAWGRILVPFCPESALSGVGRLVAPDEALWYRRDLPVAAVAGRRTLLHFEAVDYEARVWVNGAEVGHHVGGFAPFSCDITGALKDKGNTLAVRVDDDVGEQQPEAR